MKLLLAVLVLTSILQSTAAAGVHVDTLRSADQIEDAVIYSYEGCVAEISGEDCRRYNAGGIPNLYVGSSGVGRERRTIVRFPAYDGVLPDSANLQLYCWYEYDSLDRRIFAYPLIRRVYEGSEVMFNFGDYPDPDSGVTWYHAWLDAGDHDSLTWDAPGGDYVTTVACTMTVTGTGEYCTMPHVERLLAWFDSTGHDPAVILINENAVPGNYSEKLFKSTEAISGTGPRLILYTSVPVEPVRRRQAVLQRLQP